MSTLAILGSSSPDGNTCALARAVTSTCSGKLLDLSDYDVTPWDYLARNAGDDFFHLAREMAAATDIIFCTPVYWYAMSAQLKTFIDRFSDLITRNKEIGRSLAGKRTWLIATGSDETLPEGFEIPFALTSQYFQMHYSGALYGQTTDAGLLPIALEQAKVFAGRIVNKQT
ncbi:putative NAD(P)H-dependent FMN-containing oxidoreductase YwqN [Rubritalea halochordaticola]|uniref:NAD(P)H-dependent FMN-containing oxidoreductase YwqN n=1 Tax=Rubritalea halochordaticola TaxID=714537 RepID=A0ABP9UXG0_9BACT